jgi:hypothetical protein
MMGLLDNTSNNNNNNVQRVGHNSLLGLSDCPLSAGIQILSDNVRQRREKSSNSEGCEPKPP